MSDKTKAKHTICGTCKFCFIKLRRDGKLPRMGYCYGNPPGQGRLRPQVRLDDRSCSLYLKTESIKDQVITTHGED